MSLVRSCPFFASNHSNIFDPFSLDHWDPFGRCPFIKSFASPIPINESSPSPAFYARVDWKETPDAYVFKVDLPGMKKEEVEVKLEDGRVLHISGDRKRREEDEKKTDTWHRIERSIGNFFRRFRLPGPAKASDVKAAMEDGVLTVIVPKEEEKKKPEVKRIEISG